MQKHLGSKIPSTQGVEYQTKYTINVETIEPEMDAIKSMR